MRPTAFGLKAVAFYAVVVTAYFASPYTNLFFLLTSFLTIVYVLDLYWTWSNIRGVSGRLDSIPAIPAGVVTTYKARLDGGGRRRIHVQIELAVGPSRSAIGRTLLLENEQIIDCQIPALPRGVHEIHSCRATTTYPLGLLHVTAPLESQSTLVVYPTPLGEQLVDLAGGAVRGKELADSTAGASSGETAGLRDYLPGDPIRAVQWKASARSTRGLVIREFEHGADAAIEVVLDCRCEPDLLERALSAVSRLALTAQELDQPIIVRTQEIDDAFGHGRKPLVELWTWLATASVLPTDAPAAPPAMSADAIALPAALDRLEGLAT